MQNLQLTLPEEIALFAAKSLELHDIAWDIIESAQEFIVQYLTYILK